MLALIYLGLAICVGERLCGHFFRFISTAHRWATGTLVGLLLAACFTYQVGRHFASASTPLLWGDLLFFAGAAIFLIKCPPRRDRLVIETRVSRSATSDWITLGLYCALACWMMFATLNVKDGRVEIGLNQWSDYGPNTAIIQNFAFGHNFPAEYPHYAGEPIRYHFLFYFLAGNLEFLGLNLAWSENILSILTLVSLLALVMALGELLFKSRAVGIIASAFFFFHGTLNLVPFLRSHMKQPLLAHLEESIKNAAQAIYHLGGYLSSGYPYRGEDWGIWTQVVYINQRHLASSIGIFLVVLIFLFDRYLERAKQRELARAVARSRRSVPPQSTRRPSVVADLPTRYDDGERATDATSVNAAPLPAELQSAEQLAPGPETSAVGEAEPPGSFESIEESSQPANSAPVGEAQTYDTLAHDEQSRPVPETSGVGETEPSATVESSEASSQAANYASAGKAHTSDTLAYDEQLRPARETRAVREAEPSGRVESLEESSQAANDALAGEVPPTFATRPYDEYMHLQPGAAAANEAQESEALEFVKQSYQEPDAGSFTEAPSSQTTLLEPVSTRSRGIIAGLAYDTVVNGKSFIFCGLLLGALPYWNAPVFTAAAAVLAFLFLFSFPIAATWWDWPLRQPWWLFHRY